MCQWDDRRLLNGSALKMLNSVRRLEASFEKKNQKSDVDYNESATCLVILCLDMWNQRFRKTMPQRTYSATIYPIKLDCYLKLKAKDKPPSLECVNSG